MTEHAFMLTQLVSVPMSNAAVSTDGDPVPAHVRAVTELYAGPLAKVTFPDIDAASLRRQSDELRGEAKNVARAREALAAAEAAWASRLAALAETAERAVAYARIYSEAHPDRQPIVAALAELSGLTKSATTPAATLADAGKRRGRPPKHSAELFAAAPSPVSEG